MLDNGYSEHGLLIRFDSGYRTLFTLTSSQVVRVTAAVWRSITYTGIRPEAKKETVVIVS